MIDTAVYMLAGSLAGTLVGSVIGYFLVKLMMRFEAKAKSNHDVAIQEKTVLQIDKEQAPSFKPVPKTPRKSWQKIRAELESRTTPEQQREARVRSHNAR